MNATTTLPSAAPADVNGHGDYEPRLPAGRPRHWPELPECPMLDLPFDFVVGMHVYHADADGNPTGRPVVMVRQPAQQE